MKQTRTSSMMAAIWAGVMVALSVALSSASQRDDRAEEYNGLLKNFEARLAALDGADAGMYLRLAEDVAEEASEGRGVQLARALYVHAIELDRQRQGDHPVAASALLGLAELARGRQEGAWLRSIAQTLMPAGSAPQWVAIEQASLREETATKAATVLGMIRAGDGVGARAALRDLAVRALLDRYARLLSDSGAAGGVLGLEREASRWPCRECQNNRVVKRGPNDYRPCPACGGDPGTVLSDADITAQLRLESWLLSGIQRSWGAQMLADLGAPLREPDITIVAGSQGVDAGKRRWKDGQWVK